MTGRDSTDESARQLFAAMGMGNDLFLQMVKKETHRGLEGRALAGFSTGGRVYGYTSVPEPQPADPIHPRKAYVIEPAQAEIVRRIFDRFSKGHGLKRIAADLNHDRVSAPYDGVRSKAAGPGWGHSTVRAILQNSRYVGLWTWNVRKHVRVPGKRNRRALKRDPAEVVRATRPELAIVAQAGWEAAQARFRARAHVPKGRVHGEGKVLHLLSGLLLCGECSSAMSIVSCTGKNGTRYANFGCGAHKSRGDAVCANDLCVSERKAEEAITTALRRILLDGEAVATFVGAYKKRRTENGAADTETARLRTALAEAERRCANAGDAVARSGWSETLAAQLKREEERRDQLRATLAHREATAKTASTVVTTETAKRKLDELAESLAKDVERARPILRQHVGQIFMTPQGEGPSRRYVATGALNLFADLNNPVCDTSSCGGRI